MGYGQGRLWAQTVILNDLRPRPQAFRRLFIQQLCHRGRAALFVDALHHHGSGNLGLNDGDHVTGLDLSGWLDIVLINLHAATVDLIVAHRACLEEARGPQPFIDSHSVHPVLRLFEITMTASWALSLAFG